MNDYLKNGYATKDKLEFPEEDTIKKHFVAVTECIQEIPCNPCVTSCPVNAIQMEGINGTPHIDFEKCIGCGNCVAVCPGLAMFLINISNGKGRVSLPYEMLPLPKVGDKVHLLNRKGERAGKGNVIKVFTPDKSISSAVITVEFDNPVLVKTVRNIEVIR
jgi:Fe-S-cluster-containing hydrogenase component 2